MRLGGLYDAETGFAQQRFWLSGDFLTVLQAARGVIGDGQAGGGAGRLELLLELTGFFTSAAF